MRVSSAGPQGSGIARPRTSSAPLRPTPTPNGGSPSGGVNGLGSMIGPAGRGASTPPPPGPLTRGGSGRIPVPPRPATGYGAKPTVPTTAPLSSPARSATSPPAEADPGRKQKRLSISLHTDRQNVDAVVDLPIDDEAVNQREVALPGPAAGNGVNGNGPPPTRPPAVRRGPLPSPGALSQPPTRVQSPGQPPRPPSGPAAPVTGSPTAATRTPIRGGLSRPPPGGGSGRQSPMTPPVGRSPLPTPGSYGQPRAQPTLPPSNFEQPPPLPPSEPTEPEEPRQDSDTEEDTESPPPSPRVEHQLPAPDLDPAKRERLRQEALKEIVNTERDYVQHLEVALEVYLRPLKDKPKVMSAVDLANLFSNWEPLEGVNKEILSSFDRDSDNIMVGATFLSVMQYLKMYKIYCSNQPLALKILETQQAENSAFASFLQNCLKNPRCNNQNLFSYLIKPIQRLCKYPLLIKVLLNNTDPSHPDYQNLSQALVEVEEIVSYVNEGKRQAERAQKLLDLVKSIDGGESLPLVTPTRTLELETTQNIEVIIKKGKPQPRKCILFNDAVLLLKDAAKKGGKLYNTPVLLGLDEIKVVNVSDSAEFSHTVELQLLKTREAYVLIYPTEKDKIRWMKKIKIIVKQFQQRKFEEMTKAEAVSPPVSSTPSLDGGSLRRSTSAPMVQVPKRSKSTYAPATDSPKPSGSTRSPLVRRSSFNNKTQQSVTKAPVTAPPPAVAPVAGPSVRYATKPVLKIK